MDKINKFYRDHKKEIIDVSLICSYGVGCYYLGRFIMKMERQIVGANLYSYTEDNDKFLNVIFADGTQKNYPWADAK